MRTISRISILALGLSACIIPGGGVIATYITGPEDSSAATYISDAETSANTLATGPTSDAQSTDTATSVITCDAPCETGPEATSAPADTSEPPDGSSSGTTACEACPVCGDGVVESPEDCDDANQREGDACANDCRFPRVVFVTAMLHPGNFSPAPDGDAALVEADLLCQTAAEEVELPGLFKAWLSTEAGSPSARFDTEFSGAYRRRDGLLVAQGWLGLTSDTLENPINVDVNGAPVLQVATFAWTSTSSAGMLVLGGDCDNWSSGPPVLGLVGDIHATDSKWTFAEQKQCDNEFRLYCVQNG